MEQTPVSQSAAQQGQKGKLWFRRKLYGWGWTPASWEGWVVTLVYILGIVAFSLTIDDGSAPREVFFTFVLPIVLLSVAMIRIVYKKGESPRWQWGRREDEVK